MPRKSLELPPAVARNFVRDMRAFFAEKNTIKAYAIAAQQLHALREHYSGKLRISDQCRACAKSAIWQVHNGSSNTMASLIGKGRTSRCVTKNEFAADQRYFLAGALGAEDADYL
jgi:hypothetical protein